MSIIDLNRLKASDDAYITSKTKSKLFIPLFLGENDYVFPEKTELLKKYFSTGAFDSKSLDVVLEDKQLYPDLYVIYDGEDLLEMHFKSVELLKDKAKRSNAEFMFKTLKLLARQITEDLDVFKKVKESRDPLLKVIEIVYKLPHLELGYLDPESLLSGASVEWILSESTQYVDKVIRNLTVLTEEEVCTVVAEYKEKISSSLDCLRGTLCFERMYSVCMAPDCEPCVTIEEGGVRLIREHPSSYVEATYDLLRKLFFMSEKHCRMVLEETSELGYIFVNLVGKYHLTSDFEVVSCFQGKTGASPSSTLTVKEVILATECV